MLLGGVMSACKSSCQTASPGLSGCDDADAGHHAVWVDFYHRVCMLDLNTGSIARTAHPELASSNGDKQREECNYEIQVGDAGEYIATAIKHVTVLWTVSAGGAADEHATLRGSNNMVRHVCRIFMSIQTLHASAGSSLRSLADCHSRQACPATTPSPVKLQMHFCPGEGRLLILDMNGTLACWITAHATQLYRVDLVSLKLWSQDCQPAFSSVTGCDLSLISKETSPAEQQTWPVACFSSDGCSIVCSGTRGGMIVLDAASAACYLASTGLGMQCQAVMANYRNTLAQSCAFVADDGQVCAAGSSWH
jgi:WD40 repeat protein